MSAAPLQLVPEKQPNQTLDPAELVTTLCDTYAGMAPDHPDRPAIQRQIVDAVTTTLREYESEARIAKDQAAEANGRKALFERRAEAIEKAVQDAMEFAGEKQIEGEFSVLKLQATPASVIITDAERIPAGFRTIVPASWTPNKVAIKAALKAGKAVDGADLSEGNMRLVWK